MFDRIVKDVIDEETYSDIPAVTQHISDALHYNFPMGSMEIGLTAVAAYKSFEKPNNITPETMKLAYILGWLIELVSDGALISY